MKKILHLDNSEFFRKVVKTFLMEKGFQVESIAMADEAVALIYSDAISLVIMGMEFVDMSGGTFLQKILNSPHKVNTVIISSHENAGLREKMLALGVKDYIQKSENWQEKLLPYLTA